jgi:methyl-accepting chemotaxis protein
MKLSALGFGSIGAKIVGMTFLAVAAASAGVGAIGLWRQQSTADLAIASTLAARQVAIREAARDQGQRALAAAQAFAADPWLAEAMVRSDRDGILARYRSVFEALKRDLNIGLITMQRAPGIALARLHNPSAFGDDVTARRQTVVAAIRQGTPFVGIEPGRDSISIFATVPLRHNGTVIGTVDLGSELAIAFLNDLKRRMGVDIAFHLQRGDRFEPIASTIQGGTLLDGDAHRAARTAEIPWREVTLGGRPT